MKRLLIFVLIILVSVICDVHADGPLTILRSKIDKVFSILNDPVYKDEANKKEQHEKMWIIVKEAFNFEAMSQSALAYNWKTFSDEEKKEFATVFGRFLGNTYLDKIQSEFSGQQIEYNGEEIRRKDRAVVKTNIIRDGVKTPIDYSMLKNGDIWEIYDVKIEKVSLLKNYRSQFASLLIKNKPVDLINMLKDKIK